MVDFDSDATLAKSAGEIESIQVLKKREYFLEAMEAYEKSTRKGIEADTHIVGSRLTNLFMQLYSMLKRKFKDEEEFDRLERKVKSDHYEDHIEAFLIISAFLDDLQLTRIDLKKKLGGNLMTRNKSQGWG